MRRRGAFALLSSPLAPRAPAVPACAPRGFDSAQYTICTFDVRRDDIRLHWKDADGKPYAISPRSRQALTAHGRTLRFAMNAGMFGRSSRSASMSRTAGGCAAPTRAPARRTSTSCPTACSGWATASPASPETSRYLADAPPARFATQSGPMLVIDGRIHPRILPTGASAKMRNGVCVRDGTTAVFAISNEPVTFHAFARLFRDALGCANALFLDGSVSSLYAPELDRDDELDAARADARRQRAGAAR